MEMNTISKFLFFLKKNKQTIYIYIYIYYQSKVFGHPQTFLFLVLKVLFLMIQIEQYNGFIYNI